MVYIYFGVLTVTLLYHTNISSIIGYYTITACLEVFQSLLNKELVVVIHSSRIQRSILGARISNRSARWIKWLLKTNKNGG